MVEMSHLDDAGQARMVDVGGKADSLRRAVASGQVRCTPEVIEKIRQKKMVKGDVLAVARVAGIMSAKRTSELIPLCHPLPIDAVSVDFELGREHIAIRVEVSTVGKTGVEMEALTATSVAALTLYDMCKSLDRDMVIERVQLEEKTGGKSGAFVREKK